MKNYRRQNPLFSLCGLNCGLCPMHLGGHCPGCGGGEGHQSCKIIKCSLEHENVQYCYQCGEFPCSRYDEAIKFDSFITHQNMVKDLNKAKEMGIETYQAELVKKIEILSELLENYNDGRRKNFFCIAVNLLDLQRLETVMGKIRINTVPSMEVKERAAVAAKYFKDAAGEDNIQLKLIKQAKKGKDTACLEKERKEI